MFSAATKTKAKLRCAAFGPSGGGKTMSALRIAWGIAQVVGGKIGVIDTERGSASKYSDRFKFEVCELHNTSIDGYCAAIDAAAKAGFTVLIIDSLSHAWEQLLQQVEKLAQTKFRGNTWSAWSEGTPMQTKLVNTLLAFPGHVIATMRSDTEWQVEKDERSGKTKPIKVGLKPRQGKGIEYEFDLLIEITPEHIATVTKDRTGKFQDQIIEKPDEEFGKALAAWLSEGAQEGSPATPQRAEAPPPAAPATKTASPGKPVTTKANELDEHANKPAAAADPKAEEKPAKTGRASAKFRDLNQLIDKHKITSETIGGWCKWAKVKTLMEMRDQHLEQIISKVIEKYEPKKQEEDQPLLI